MAEDFKDRAFAYNLYYVKQAYRTEPSHVLIFFAGASRETCYDAGMVYGRSPTFRLMDNFVDSFNEKASPKGCISISTIDFWHCYRNSGDYLLVAYNPNPNSRKMVRGLLL